MNKATTLTPHKNGSSEAGMASIEGIAMITIFLLLISYTLGFFGVIHTAILHSIGARGYAFETFRHRTNLTYFREVTKPEHYKKYGSRFHAVVSEHEDNLYGFWASARPIAIGRSPAEKNRKNADTHNNKVPALRTGVRNEQVEVSPVWIKVRYGICLNSGCGDS